MDTLIIVVASVAAIGIAGIFFVSLTAARPTDLGIHDGRLSDLPPTPNCVSSYATDELQGIQPLVFAGDPAKALAKVRQIVAAMRGATLVESHPDYLHVEFRSSIFRFVDDVEFQLDDKANQIHFRSASRTGYSDIGMNRTRMERIRKLFESRQQLTK